jgi:hypothetical protein
MKNVCILGASCVLLIVCGCAQVNVTKTAKGYFDPTNPDEIEILVTIPRERPYIELATVTTRNWSTSDTAKMHNSLRAKCAPLGANAVILGSSGIDYNGYFWASGVAIRYSDSAKGAGPTGEIVQPTNTNQNGRKVIGYKRAPDDAIGEKAKWIPVYESPKP